MYAIDTQKDQKIQKLLLKLLDFLLFLLGSERFRSNLYQRYTKCRSSALRHKFSKICGTIFGISDLIARI